MIRKIAAGICLLGLCAGLLQYNFSLRPDDDAPTTPTEPPKPVGKVCYVNPDPSLQTTWEALATDFTGQTGIPVTIVPAHLAEGVTPTLFTVDSQAALDAVADVCLELAGTNATHHMLDWSLALYSGKKMCGLPVQVEGFGLIYNAELLRQAGQTAGDITSFAKLAEVVDLINSKTALKFSPFACANMESAAMSAYISMPGDLRPFWDLYIQNTACKNITAHDDGPLEEILDGKAAFCLGSTEEYGVFSAMSESNLNIMPLYIGMGNEEQQGLCLRVKYYWCVRNDVPQQDIDATLAFLDFLLHPTEVGMPVDRLEILTPYTGASYCASPLEKTLRGYIAAGKKCLVFSGSTSPEDILKALEAYAADPTDENWEKVTQAME